MRQVAGDMLDRHRGEDPFFLFARLITLLLEYGGREPQDLAGIAQHAADRSIAGAEWHRAQTYQELVATCHAKAGQLEESRQMRMAAAEVLVSEAAALAKSQQYLVASAPPAAGHSRPACRAWNEGTRERPARHSPHLSTRKREGDEAHLG